MALLNDLEAFFPWYMLGDSNIGQIKPYNFHSSPLSSKLILSFWLFWFRLLPATKAPRGHPSPCRGAEENEKKEAETGGSG